jgi:hypothetical protein
MPVLDSAIDDYGDVNEGKFIAQLKLILGDLLRHKINDHVYQLRGLGQRFATRWGFPFKCRQGKTFCVTLE